MKTEPTTQLPASPPLSSSALLAAALKLQAALKRGCADSCYCGMRAMKGIPGKCWACSGRDVLQETAE
jgi:hypothetical protein